MVVENISDKSLQRHIRFKFMPTPSCRLHVGHAWLLLIMDRLARQARDAGYKADIVLVIDDLTGSDQELTPEKMYETETGILEDTAWLEIEFSKVIHNSSFPYVSNVQGKLIHTVACSTLAPASLYPAHLNTLVLGTQYYIKNCIIDAALGITHMIRGADQLARVAVYRSFYELLGMPSPTLVYLPFVCNAGGGKIGTDGTYSIEAVRKHLSRDELMAIVVRQCLKRSEPDTAETWNIQEAQKQLLGDDWDWILGKADSASKLTSFFGRIESAPKVATKEQLIGTIPAEAAS